jgi:hypothetical protein
MASMGLDRCWITECCCGSDSTCADLRSLLNAVADQTVPVLTYVPYWMLLLIRQYLCWPTFLTECCCWSHSTCADLRSLLNAVADQTVPVLTYVPYWMLLLIKQYLCWPTFLTECCCWSNSTCADLRSLLNAAADQTVPVLTYTYVPAANTRILLLLLHLGCTTKQRSLPSENVHLSLIFI